MAWSDWEYLNFSLDGMPINFKVTPCILVGFPDNCGTHLYTPGWRDSDKMRVKCITQDHSILTQLSLEPRPLDQWTLRLPYVNLTIDLPIF